MELTLEDEIIFSVVTGVWILGGGSNDSLTMVLLLLLRGRVFSLACVNQGRVGSAFQTGSVGGISVGRPS